MSTSNSSSLIIGERFFANENGDTVLLAKIIVDAIYDRIIKKGDSPNQADVDNARKCSEEIKENGNDEIDKNVVALETEAISQLFTNSENREKITEEFSAKIIDATTTTGHYSHSTGGDNTLLYIVGGLLTLEAVFLGYRAYRDYYYGEPVAAKFKKRVRVNGVLFNNAVVDDYDRVLLDYKGRPLVDLEVDEDGKTLLFNGRSIVVTKGNRLFSFEKELLNKSPGGNIYTSTGSLHRLATPSEDSVD